MVARIGVQQQFVETVGLLSIGKGIGSAGGLLLYEMNLAVGSWWEGFGRGDPGRGLQPVSDLPRPF